MKIYMQEARISTFITLLPIIILFLLVMSLVFVIATPRLDQVQIASCIAEDAASSAGTWGTACDNAYPGTVLHQDDESYEVHTIRRVGVNSYWGGLRINSSNLSVLDCKSIVDVAFCYKWWSATDNITNCDVSVDADGGASYTAIDTSCPGISEPGGVTCVNVTSLEGWNCSHFFGSSASGALAKSEGQHNGQGENGYYDVTWDVFYFNVTYDNETVDFTPPEFTNLANQTLYAGQSLYYDVDAYDDNGISCFKVNDTDNFQIDCSGVLTNASALSLGDYWLEIIVNDTFGNNQTGELKVTVTNESLPSLIIWGVTPQNGSGFEPLLQVTIGANITANQTNDSVSSASAVISYPNGSALSLLLSGNQDWYSAVFSAPLIYGRYDFNITANSTLGEYAVASSYFNVADMTAPSITQANMIRSVLFTGQSSPIIFRADDDVAMGSCWIEVLMPDMNINASSISCTGVPLIYWNTNLVGEYLITFFANDSFGNTANASDAYEVFPKVDVNYTLKTKNASTTIGMTLYKEDENEVIYSDDYEGDEVISLPDTDLDFEFKSFSDRIYAKLKKVGVAASDGLAFGLDKHNSDPGYLVTYVVDNEHLFEEADVTICYDDLSASALYSVESDLHIYKCDNYNFDSRTCNSGWDDITSSASQDLANHCFDFTTASFSGFSIKEYTPPPIEDDETPSSVGSFETYSDFWRCGIWSDCVDGVESRECIQYNMHEEVLGSKMVERNCTSEPLEDELGEVDIPRKSFDVTLITLDSSDPQSKEGFLSIIAMLENYEKNPLSLELDFRIVDSEGKEVFRDARSVVVTDLLMESYTSSDALPSGEYAVVLEVRKGDGQDKQRFEKVVRVGERGILAWTRQVYRQDPIFNWINGAALVVIIGLSLAYYFFSRKEYGKAKPIVKVSDKATLSQDAPDYQSLGRDKEQNGLVAGGKTYPLKNRKLKNRKPRISTSKLRSKG
ncbi:hypothetical protein JW711_04880 [Candidatus Woesearchaeota archaeon]|nr:hypothetical protein [Candidatus Woesearchaeota archaeon]